MASYPTNTPDDASLYIALDNFGTTLNGAINASQTTITLTSVTGLPVVGILQVDSEKIRYTGISGNDITGCTRGFSSTVAAAHSNGAQIEFLVFEEHHNVLKDEIKAIALDLRDSFSADLNDSATVAATASDLTERLDQIVTQIKEIIGGADWKDSVPIGLSSLTSKANQTLNNLASVAINTSLISDTDNTDDLGSTTVNWKNLYLKGSIFYGTTEDLKFADGIFGSPTHFSYTIGGQSIADFQYREDTNKLYCRSLIMAENGDTVDLGIRRFDGTYDSPSALSAGSLTGVVYFQPYGSNGDFHSSTPGSPYYGRIAQIQGRCYEAPTGTNRAGALGFLTTKSGEVIVRERMWLDHQGYLVIAGRGASEDASLDSSNTIGSGNLTITASDTASASAISIRKVTSLLNGYDFSYVNSNDLLALEAVNSGTKSTLVTFNRSTLATQFQGVIDTNGNTIASLTSEPFRGDWNGWVDPNETWTYASSTSFTISGDKTSKYSVGDKLKLDQSGVKYFYVTAVSYSNPNTTVTITGGSDYTLANSAISSPRYSKLETPSGFPVWFNYSAVASGSTGSAGTYSQDNQTRRFKLEGTYCSFNISFRITDKGSWTGNVLVNRPINQVTSDFGSEGLLIATGGTTTRAFFVEHGTSGYFQAQDAVYSSNINWSSVAVNDTVHLLGSFRIA